MLAPTAVERLGREAALNDMFKSNESAFEAFRTWDLVWHEIPVSQIATKLSTVGIYLSTLGFWQTTWFVGFVGIPEVFAFSAEADLV